MNELLQFSHASNQTELTNSALISVLTILGIVFLFGAIFQEVHGTLAQATDTNQQVANVVEK